MTKLSRLEQMISVYEWDKTWDFQDPQSPSIKVAAKN